MPATAALSTDSRLMSAFRLPPGPLRRNSPLLTPPAVPAMATSLMSSVRPREPVATNSPSRPEALKRLSVITPRPPTPASTAPRSPEAVTQSMTKLSSPVPAIAVAMSPARMFRLRSVVSEASVTTGPVPSPTSVGRRPVESRPGALKTPRSVRTRIGLPSPSSDWPRCNAIVPSVSPTPASTMMKSAPSATPGRLWNGFSKVPSPPAAAWLSTKTKFRSSKFDWAARVAKPRVASVATGQRRRT